ncbi:hypothetical protein Tco_0517774 [Tanacetum coccineum]
MDDPNITMEEYIRLEEEKARRRAIAFIETLMSEPTVDYFNDFENEFPAIVYNDALTSKSDFLTEPTLSPQHIDEFNLKYETSLSEYDEEEQNIANTAYPNTMSMTYSLSGCYPVFIFSIVYTTYSLNEYSVYMYQYDVSWGPRGNENDKVGGVFISLEISRCWSLGTSRRLFNTRSCSKAQIGESTEQISGNFLIAILFNSCIFRVKGDILLVQVYVDDIICRS